MFLAYSGSSLAPWIKDESPGIAGQIEKISWSLSYFCSVFAPSTAAFSATCSLLLRSDSFTTVSSATFAASGILKLMSHGLSPDPTIPAVRRERWSLLLSSFSMPDSPSSVGASNPQPLHSSLAPLNWSLRYFVLRIALFVLLIGSILGTTAASAQDSSSNSGARPSGTEPAAVTSEPDSQSISDQVVAAEAAIGGSDFKTAEAKLNPWLATHPKDARALFDAGYAADAENRLDDAAGLYRRAVNANPRSFEAHLSLGLLLARQGKPAEARPELAAATTLDPGLAGPALKARAWRALAQIGRAH